MDVRDFDFDLPPELIAQEPAAERGQARLLLLSRDNGALVHATVSALPDLLHAGDLLVVNNTRVFPARLFGRRVPTGGAVECMLIERLDGDRGRAQWEALMHPGQKLEAGAEVIFEGRSEIHGRVLARRFHGRRLIELWTERGSSLEEAVDAIGHVPLPPYIKRIDRPEDRERYQTVFARARGSVAAPTAGLHLSEGLIRALVERDVEVVEITLHVGYGTFQPVRVDRVEDHRIEPERFEISEGAAATINRALDQRRRVVAVGTTTTRALEAVALSNGGRLAPGAGQTGLFIYPGFEFRVVGGLMTNFHLPRSSLLMLVSAFAGGPSTGSGRPEQVEGRQRVLAAYGVAVTERYRFYSYGDAMLVL